MKKATNEYINKEQFHLALVEYKDQVNEAKANNTKPPRLSNYLGECFIKLAHNLAKRPNFNQYTYKDEMISDALEDIMLYIHNYDPNNNKKNPFGYFTKICWYAFVNRIHTEKTEQYIKCKATESFGTLDEEELYELDDETIQQVQLYDNLYQFVEQYESNLQKKKSKTKQKLKGLEKFIEA